MNLLGEFAFQIHKTIRLLSFSEASVLKNTCNRSDIVNKISVPNERMKLFRIKFRSVIYVSIQSIVFLN